MSLIVPNGSMPWYEYNRKFTYNLDIDPKLQKLYDMKRVKFVVDDDKADIKVCKI